MSSTIPYVAPQSPPADEAARERLLARYQAILADDEFRWVSHQRKICPLGSGGQEVFLTERQGADDFTLPVALKVFSPEKYLDDAAYRPAHRLRLPRPLRPAQRLLHRHAAGADLVWPIDDAGRLHRPPRVGPPLQGARRAAAAAGRVGAPAIPALAAGAGRSHSLTQSASDGSAGNETPDIG